MLSCPALAVCFAEFRSSVRRVRTFLCLAIGTAGILGTLALTTFATSQMAPLAGAYAPRFVLSVMGNSWLWLFLLAAVFLAFDARQQDERARIAEVLDVRPISNVALLGGRVVATVLVAWLALVVIAVLIQTGGTISRVIDEGSGSEISSLAWSLAVAVDPVSLVTLLTIDALPVATRPGETLERLHFSLNPALEVSAVQIADTTVDTTHLNGTLSVDLPAALGPDTELTVSLQAKGVPDERFAYVDSVVGWRRLPASNRLVLLGTDALLFNRHYVALPPGAAWLPSTGPNLAHCPPDGFTVDLSVRV